jgi:hypothetical protein
MSEIEHGEEIAPCIVLASKDTKVRGREVWFAESRMAEFLGEPTVLVDINGGPQAVATGLAAAAERLRCDLIVFIDVGGDVLAQGHEPGLTSPLCDAVMLAAAARLGQDGHPVLAGVFGLGCDAELTPDEVLERLASVAQAGGLCGARGLTEPVARRMEEAIAVVPTEASAQAVSAFRGASGKATIRGGRRTVELSASATLTFYLDVARTVQASGRLAQAAAGAQSLEEANRALNDLGVQTELDREREATAPR